MKNKPQKRLVDCRIEETGRKIILERHEVRFPLTGFEYDGKYKMLCQGCPSYGKNLSCPPHSPTLLHHVEGCKTARVVCLRVSLEHFAGPEGYREGYRVARKLLEKELLHGRKKGFIAAGAGPCRACDRCSLEQGENDCRKPEKRIYSLESLGVNVEALVKACFDFDLEWSGGKKGDGWICAVGALFS